MAAFVPKVPINNQMITAIKLPIMKANKFKKIVIIEFNYQYY